VRWVNEANVHTSTAYHPANDGHALRIPEAAEPWDSGYLVGPGDRFEVTLTVPGVYDYFCVPHEIAGMVGRIIVGRPGGPATLPFDDFQGDPASRDWRPVPKAAQAAFPPIEAIMKERLVRATAQLEPASGPSEKVEGRFPGAHTPAQNRPRFTGPHRI
jgi:plastocyanin